MADATRVQNEHRERVINSAAAAVAAGELWQLPDGRAAVYCGANAAASGDAAGFDTEGVFKLTKTTSVVILDGQDVYWDHSANAATYWPSNDRDFWIGTAVGDAASSATTILVNLNVRNQPIIDLHESAFEHVPVLTSGTPSLSMVGGTARAAFSATAEAQKLDLLSKRSFPTDAEWIAEFVFEVSTNADADVGDLNIGVANDTHASDADSITESCFVHLDMGGSLNILAESDDGTTEVAATDTTIDWAVGTPVHVVMDGRTPNDVQVYVNGVLVLSGSTFTFADATGPLKFLFHLEKTADDSPGVVELDRAHVRIAEQAA